MTSPAERLLGLVVDSKWTVEELFPKKPYTTGGNFSTGYRVKGLDGKTYFLKALDIEAALSGEEMMKDLEAFTRDFNFEAGVNDLCRGLDRVVACVGHGYINVDPTNILGRVPYLVFEEAEGDIRRNLVRKPTASAWRFRALHHIATGLHQLHGREIRHQDLKPSNIMTFESTTKVGDLGRANCDGIPSRFDVYPFAGDKNYAPPEILYRQPLTDFSLQRRATDMFMLASMTVFLFGGVTLQAALLDGIPATNHPKNQGCTFADALPFLQATFGRTVDLVVKDLGVLGARTRSLLAAIGEPDPTRRGHQKNRNHPGTQYSLERVLAEFDLLARQAQLEKL